MSESSSFRLRYVGSRFEGKRLPVDVLSDLPAFRDLILAFASAEWRRQNKHRKRLPKGFNASLALDLIAIEDGSAVPVLKWNRETTQAHLPGFSDQIEDTVTASFGQVILLFSEASAGKFPTALESPQIAALNKFGANLRENERIEFQDTPGQAGEVVYVTADIRKHLIGRLRGHYVAQIEDMGILLGCVVVPGDPNGMGYIVVQTATHGEFQIPTANDTLMSEFDGNIRSPIELNLQAEFDSQDRISGIVEVQSVSLIDEQIASQLTRCRERVDQISALENGWRDGSGLGPSSAAIANAVRFLNLRFSFCDLYRIYPSAAGGVLFELEIKGWDLSIEFLEEGRVRVEGVEIGGVHEIETTFGGIDKQFLSYFDSIVQ